MVAWVTIKECRNGKILVIHHPELKLKLVLMSQHAGASGQWWLFSLCCFHNNISRITAVLISFYLTALMHHPHNVSIFPTFLSSNFSLLHQADDSVKRFLYLWCRNFWIVQSWKDTSWFIQEREILCVLMKAVGRWSFYPLNILVCVK